MSPKGVIFLKILIYEFFGFFGNLFLFLRILIPLKIGKKGVYLSQEPRADVARRGTRANATWHARPRGSAAWTHMSACMARRWRGCVAGPHESTRTHERSGRRPRSSCILRKIRFGESWGRERSAYRISGRPEVVWGGGGDQGFRKKLPAKVWKLPAELPI